MTHYIVSTMIPISLIAEMEAKEIKHSGKIGCVKAKLSS